MARMKGILTPFVIRRLKVEVEHQLPAKSQEVSSLLLVASLQAICRHGASKCLLKRLLLHSAQRPHECRHKPHHDSHCERTSAYIPPSLCMPGTQGALSNCPPAQ